MGIDKLIQEGDRLHESQKFEQALQYYKEALDIEPKNKQILYKMAVSLRLLKKYEESIELCDRILDDDSTNIETFFRRA